MKITEQGYCAGGSPPYGTRRLLLDEKREPLHPLEPGQRKGIQNQRVTLIEGDTLQVAVIQPIFHEFVDLGYSDFFVLDRKLALSIQPAVPVPSGYAAYWPIRPDSRHVIDITLGVLLSDPEELDILGYVALPRGLAGTDTWRVCSSSTRTDSWRC